MNPYQIVSTDSLLIGHAYLVGDVENLDLANLRFVLSSPVEDIDHSQPDSSLAETSDSFSSPAKFEDRSETNHCQSLPDIGEQNSSYAIGLEGFLSTKKCLQGNARPETNENTAGGDAKSLISANVNTCENVDSSLYYSKKEIKRLGKPFHHGFQRVCLAKIENGIPRRVTTVYYLSPPNDKNVRKRLRRCGAIIEAIKGIPELSKDNFSFHRKILGFGPNLEIIKPSTVTPFNSSRSNFWSHVKILKDPKIVFCTLCSKITNRAEISRHMRRHHNIGTITYSHSAEVSKALNETSCEIKPLDQRNRKAEKGQYEHQTERNSVTQISEEIDLSMESLTADDTDREENMSEALVNDDNDEDENKKEIVNCTNEEDNNREAVVGVSKKEDNKNIVKESGTYEDENKKKVGDDFYQPSVSVSNYNSFENSSSNFIPYIAVKSKPVIVESLSLGLSPQHDQYQEGKSESDRVMLTLKMTGETQTRMMSKTGIRLMKPMKKFARKIGVQLNQLKFLQMRRVGMVDEWQELRGDELVGQQDQSVIMVDWRLNS